MGRGSPSQWHERIGRLGFTAKGILYGLVGIIAIAVALGGEKSTADQTGALASLSDSAAGTALLVALAVGLGAYALFNLIEVFDGSLASEDGEEKLERVASVFRAVIYGGLCVSAVLLLANAGSSSGNEDKTASTAFDLPAGVVLVFIAGAVIVGVGLYQAYTGVSTSFEDALDQSRMSAGMRSAAKALGIGGHLARAVVFSLIGGFLIKAAVEHSSKQAIGLDGALQEISQQTYGSLMLFVVAVGLFVYGAFCLIEARYKRL